MQASRPTTPPRVRLPGGRRLWVGVPVTLLLLLVFGSWYLTEPLEDPGSTNPPPPVEAKADIAEASLPEAREWPSTRLEGLPAKQLLLDALLEAERRLATIGDYTATFRKRERINGRLGDEHVMEMKVRNQPFAIYLKFIEPEPGKEVVFAEGHHDDKVIAHSGGLGRLLIPRLAVPPTHSLAMANSRHPITEAGLAKLVTKLIGYRRMDLDDAEAVTILDRTEGPDGRPLLRSVHSHPVQHPDRPFARVEVLYDPETRIPVQISSYDWPGPEHSGDLLLAEQYIYHDLDLDVDLGHHDFDPANPEYAFHRF